MNDKEYELQLKHLDELCNDDYRKVSQLLIDLDDPIAGRLALEILHKKKGDRYLQAFAFSVFYDAYRSEAIDYICRYAKNTETYIVGTMISNVTIDSEQEEGREELMKAVEVLKQVLQEKTPEDLEDISDDVEWFLQSFKIQL